MPKFYGQFNPPVDKFIYERYFENCGSTGFFVECGACDGVLESSCKFFEETLGWQGMNIEASPPNFRELEANRPNSRNRLLALSNQDGIVSFSHAVHPKHSVFGNGSVGHTEAHRQALMQEGCTFETYDIPSMTWGSLMVKEQLNYVDLLVLDVEGHEMEVIQGMKGSILLPDILCIEVGHLSLEAIRRELKSLGYIFDTTSNINAFFLRPQRRLKATS